MILFMRKSAAVLLPIFLSLCVLTLPAYGEGWQELAPGLHLGKFTSPQKSICGDNLVTVLKISPKRYSFRLICASEHDKAMRTAKEWCQKFKLVAAINASMFRGDCLTSTGLMKNYNHINNPRLTKNYKSVLGFNRGSKEVPAIQLIDLECDDYETLKAKYDTLVQNIRMISCQGKNVWSQQNKKWSTVSLGTDGGDNVLFIFTRSPYSVHDLINILLKLPIDIKRAMYLEGGPEASLYVSANGVEVELFGSYETYFKEDDSSEMAWPIPNVIGIELMRK